MNEQERAVKFLDKLKELQEDYGFSFIYNVFDEKIYAYDRESNKRYELEQ